MATCIEREKKPGNSSPTRRSSWITIGAKTTPAPKRGAPPEAGSLTPLDHDPIRLNRIMISSLLFKHDLFGKPVPTFPDHALVAGGTRDPSHRPAPETYG